MHTQEKNYYNQYIPNLISWTKFAIFFSHFLWSTINVGSILSKTNFGAQISVSQDVPKNFAPNPRAPHTHGDKTFPWWPEQKPSERILWPRELCRFARVMHSEKARTQHPSFANGISKLLHYTPRLSATTPRRLQYHFVFSRTSSSRTSNIRGRACKGDSLFCRQ